MNNYCAPLADIRFALELAGLDDIAGLPGCEDLSDDLAQAVLDQAGKFAAEVLSPLNRIGDIEGCRLDDGSVTTPAGWRSAFEQFRDGGWVGLGLPARFGGQGLPKILATPVYELWASANMAFSLLFPLATGATEALTLAASESVQQTYLPRIVSGEWTATMALTEPQAGSDLAAVRCRAEPDVDGNCRLFGQKIFITYGDHDLTDNIVHLVLARLPDAPPGVKGISLFVVPKFLVAADGSCGARNDVKCVSIEHKLGIHGSPTCVLVFGDEAGAIGQLVGEPNRGLETMFVMMNAARLGTGIQGIAIGERAYQQALAYARERVQGRDIVTGRAGVPIVEHPDVKRMLLNMRARVMAARLLAYEVAALFDRADHHPDKLVAEKSRRLVDLLTPVVKAWSTEVGNEVVSLGVQVHGGMGVIEETGAAQHLRDARVTTIYEGTTGIQANDLLGRKILREQGATLKLLIEEIENVAEALQTGGDLVELGIRLRADAVALRTAADSLLTRGAANPGVALSVAVPFLHLVGLVCGEWQLGRAALAASCKPIVGQGDKAYRRHLINLARFYAVHVAPLARAKLQTILAAEAAAGAFIDDLP